MPSRRHKSSEKKEPESRPTVTQVVEVIEEEVPQQVEDPPQTEVPVDRKAMVEELFTPEKKEQVMPEISLHKKSSKKPILVWAIVTIIVALVTGGILYATSNKASMPAFISRPTPTPTPMPEPTPTPTPKEIDKASFEIEVLNGGGTPGAAGKMKTFLEDLGYTVVDTGNTDEYTYETTEIHGKSEMTDAIAALKADLKDEYSLGIVEADLDASASADVQVIVGKE